MSHTKGKLEADGSLIKSQNGEMVAGTVAIASPEVGQSSHEANTRRIVACWNLLLPFTTEEIEAGIDLEKLVRENAALKEEVERFKAVPALSPEPVGFRYKNKDEREDDWSWLPIRFLERNKSKDRVYELLYTALPPEDDYVGFLEESKAELKSENEKLREAIQNFLDTCEATNPLINGPTFVAIDALHAVMEGK